MRYKKLIALMSLPLLLFLVYPKHLVAKDQVNKKKTTVVSGKKPSKKEYRINSLDILKINIFMEDDLQKVYRVSQSGYISYPFAGKVRVAGLTVSELEEKLTRLLSPDYFVSPQITGYVKEYHSRKIFILGAVNNPGSYSIPPEKELSVVEAISLAGGFTKVAALNKTKIIRVENGREKNIEVKITEITKEGDKSKDIKLQPNDIIIIPESFF